MSCAQLYNINRSSPISWTFTGFACEQVLRHFRTNESIRLALLVHRSPFLTELVDILLAFDFSLCKLSVVSFGAGSGSFSDSVSDFSSSLFIFIHHIAANLLALLFDLGQRFGSASISHSLLNQRGIKSFFLHDFFELIHGFVFLVGSSVPFQSMFFPECMFFTFDLVVSFLNFRINFRHKVFFNLHAFHLEQKIFFFL